MTTLMTKKPFTGTFEEVSSYISDMREIQEEKNFATAEELFAVAKEKYDLSEVSDTSRINDYAFELIENNIIFPVSADDIKGHNDQIGNETVKLSEIEIEALLDLVDHQWENCNDGEEEVYKALHENLSNCNGELKVTIGYKEWLLDDIFGTLYEGMNTFYRENTEYWNAFCSVYGIDPETGEEVEK